MSFDEVIAWSNAQGAEWTKDALRRLARATAHKLSDAECAEVLMRVKHANGILSTTTPVCTPLSAADLPADVAATERTLLCSIGQVQNVDRLARDQTLSFAINGLTLIYGDNGSGKSGYSRITKKLCRSLTVDPLRGNVFERPDGKPAEVVVRYKTDAQQEPIAEPWVDGNSAPAAIANVSVFDTKNARLYVDNDNEIQYLPPAIEMMEQYNSLLQGLAEQIEIEVNEVKRRTAVPLPTGFTPGTAVHGVIDTINAAPPVRRGAARTAVPVLPLPTKAALTAASVWNETLAVEQQQLEEQLRDDPQAQADKRKRAVAILTAFTAELKIIEEALSDPKTKELEVAQRNFITTKLAAEAAAENAFKDEPLRYTGSEPWKLMYKYAKEYAQVAAGADVDIAAVDDLCVACQQTLTGEAKIRLKKFEDYVTARANTEAEAASAVLTTKILNIRDLRIPTQAQVTAQFGEFGTLGDDRKALITSLGGVVEAIQQRREGMLLAVDRGDFSKLEPVAESITGKLDAEVAALIDEEAVLREKARTDGARTTERSRLANLRDQKRLSETIETFSARLDDLQQLKKLKDCKEALSIASVTPFITRLRKNLVTADLQSRINSEIATFDLSHIPFSVKDRSDDGRSVVGVKLKAVADVANNEVLSEGEQRALALACFLGEVTGDPVKHGIIIDDPVSSLDHIRVRKVAERLVKEAAEGRQVVVFTHNVLFYSEVVYAAGQLSPQVPLKRHCIRHDTTKGFGIVHEDDEPWIAKDVGTRAEMLRTKRLPVLKDRTDRDTDEYRREVKDFYTDLRETWERLVEEILLGGVVGRFNAEVKTQSLKRVIVEDADHQTIFHAMKRVSERSGHDTAQGRAIPMPDYDEMKRDLDELDTYRSSIKRRATELQKVRELLEEPPKAKVA